LPEKAAVFEIAILGHRHEMRFNVCSGKRSCDSRALYGFVCETRLRVRRSFHDQCATSRARPSL